MQVCPRCGVRITHNDEVLFSVGKPATRERLFARVCQFAKADDCINKGIKSTDIRPEDNYGEFK